MQAPSSQAVQHEGPTEEFSKGRSRLEDEKQSKEER